MRFIPTNRNILVAPLTQDEQKTTSGVLLPEDYNSKEPDFTAVKLVESAQDVTNTNLTAQRPGATLIVQTSMIEKVKFRGTTYSLVKENYVMGVIVNE